MPNQNQFFSEAGTFSIDQVIKGQTPLTFYDPLKQVAYQPSIRRNANGKIGAILPYADTGLWGMMSQLGSYLGTDNKTVNARKYWWAEYDQFQTYSFAIGKASGGVPAAGASVQVNVSRSSMSSNGLFAKPLAGFKAMIKDAGTLRQIVNITSVVESSAGVITITLQPINNQVLNLTAKSQYTVLIAGMRNYHLDATNDIQTQGMVKNPPALYQSQVQKFELGYADDESEIDNYVYDKDIMIAKGLNARGQEVEYYYTPQLTTEMEDTIVQNRLFNTLFNRHNNSTDEDFDALIPTIEKYGLFNYAYDIFLGGSLKSLLFSMIKSLRKINGSNDYFLIHDFNFGIDWSEAIAMMVKNYNQDYRYKLFGEGGEGLREFEYFNFKNFSWSNYHFMTYQMDAFDSYRFGRPLEYFAMLLPAKAYTDTDGNRVPIMNYVNIKGAEPAKDQAVWVDDARARGGRNLRIFGKDSFGLEIHKPTQLGMIQRNIISQN